MSEWAAKRFWAEVYVSAEAGGFAVLLDDRPLRTPFKTPVLAPTRALADSVAAEWAAQDDVIDPHSMPYTRALNSALDKVAPNPGPVAEMLAGYAETDLLCYRATHPQELVDRQAEIWGPYLDWADEAFGARLRPVAGVMPEDQDRDALLRLAEAVRAHDAYALTALHEVVTLTGSLILGLAALNGKDDATAIWGAARLDEIWQAEQWGSDEEAEDEAAIKGEAVAQALRFYTQTRPPA